MAEAVPERTGLGGTERRWLDRLLGVLPFAVLAAGLAFTLAAWRSVDAALQARVRAEFEEHARETTRRIGVRLHDDEQVLRGGVGLFLASGQVTREEWRDYVAALRLSENFAGIQGVGFSEWVPPGGLQAHERRVRGEGFPDYQVRPAGEREAYTAIVYLEPFDWRNRRAFGYDMFSEPVRRAAMERARDGAEAALSGRIVLVQETEKDRQHGVLIYLPVYRTGRPVDTVAQRREALLGFVYSPIRVKDLVYGALGALPQHVSFQVFAAGEPRPEALVFDSREAEPAQASGGRGAALQVDQRLELLGQAWVLRFQSLPAFGDAFDQRAAPLLLAGGLAVSLLLFGATLMLTRARRRAVASASALREGEARYRTLFDQGPDGVVVLDPATRRFVDFNDKACAQLGYTREEFAALSLSDVDATETPDQMRARIASVMEAGHGEFEARQRHRSGAIRDVQVTARYVQLGGRWLYLCIWRDVTAQKAAEAARRAEEARFQSYFDMPLFGAAITSREKAWLTVNDRLCAMLGYTREELTARTWPELTHPDDLGRDTALFEEVLRGARDGYTIEKRFLRRSGEVLWARLAAQAVRDEAGRVAYFTVLIEDVTARKREEQLVQARLELMDEAFGCTLQESLVRTLDKVEALTGSSIGFYHFVMEDEATLTLQAWSTRTARDFCRAEGTGVHYPVAQAGVWADCIRQRGPVFHNDYRSMPGKKGMPPGHAEVLRELVVPVFRRGKIVAALGVGNKAADYTDEDVAVVTRFADLAWDLAERKLVQERLRESDARFAAAFDNAPMMMTLSRLDDGRYLSANRRFLEVSGFTAGEAMGRTSVELGWITAEERAKLVTALREGGRVQGLELRVRTKAGKDRLVRFWGELLSVGGERCLLSIAQDVTEERAMERQLAQAQRLESVGRLAGGVAHDFNNMLAVIIGHADMLLRREAPGEAIREDLEEIADAARRAAVVTRQLLAFARKQTVEPRVLDLNETVEGTLKMLRRLIGEDIDLSWSPAPSLRPVRLDPSQVDQVLANLCVNARDAIAGVGRVTIRTANVDPEPAFHDAHPQLAPGPCVRLTVTDDGAGIRPEVLPLIFEPFFTTKESGRGTGLGLATVYGIVKQNGGAIEVESTPGVGTAFHLYLPAVEGAPGEAVRPAAEPAGAVGGHETVLVVEDEPAVLKLCCDLLASLGYQVIPACGPAEAIRQAGRNAGRLQLLLTDVVMPDMSGRDLATMLVLGHPGLKVLFMSGYTGEAVSRHGLAGRDGVFVQKPFTREELAAKVREALAARPRPVVA